MLYPHQKELAFKAVPKLKEYHLCYFSWEPQTGKTRSSLEVAKLMGYKRTLFVTTAKNIRDKTIVNQYNEEGYKFAIDFINYQSIHKVKPIYDFYIIDEAHCFLPGTLIDGKKIEDIRIGDTINSYNHRTKIIEKKKIVNLFKNKINNTLYRVCLGNRVIVCTGNHQVYTINKGYIKAKNLEKGDQCYVHNELPNLRKRDFNKQQSLSNEYKSGSKRFRLLLRRMFPTMATHSIFYKNASKAQNPLYDMRERSYRYGVAFLKMDSTEQCDMFAAMPDQTKEYKNFCGSNRREQESQFRTHETKQSDVGSKSTIRNDPNIKKDQTQTKNSRWKWTYISSRRNSIEKIRRFFYGTIRTYNSKNIKGRIQDPLFLQNRYSQLGTENCNRNRRIQPSITCQERARCKENESLGIVRVESIEIYEPTGNEQLVYNLEVEDNHNYFANNILVHNCCGQVPKPGVYTGRLKKLIEWKPVLFLSGTPTPETFSQIYHQFWISLHSPFKEYANFYKWSHEYVNIKQVNYNGVRYNDYSDCDRDKVMKILDKYFIPCTQEEAGIKQNIIESVINVEIDPNVKLLINRILKTSYYQFKDGSELVCDTAVKKQQKLHQLYSGTVKTETSSKILDYSKARYIRDHYKNQKIAIFYKYISEGIALRETLTNWTDNADDFHNSADKIFISQVQSGCMGISLRSADVLIFYNIDFSAMRYFQAKERIQNSTRNKPSIVHWLFAQDGIENQIYKCVIKKKSFTNYYFKKQYLGEN